MATNDYYFWIFSVLTCESDSCILQSLNELNLTYQILTGFMMLFHFILIVLVPWGKFSLCHTSIIPILAFKARLRNKVISFCYFCFFSVPLSFSVFALFIFLFFVSESSKKKKQWLYFILVLSLIISVAYIYI